RPHSLPYPARFRPWPRPGRPVARRRCGAGDPAVREPREARGHWPSASLVEGGESGVLPLREADEVLRAGGPVPVPAVRDAATPIGCRRRPPPQGDLDALVRAPGRLAPPPLDAAQEELRGFEARKGNRKSAREVLPQFP